MSTIEQQARIELSLNAQKATDKLNELTKESSLANLKVLTVFKPVYYMIYRMEINNNKTEE